MTAGLNGKNDEDDLSSPVATARPQPSPRRRWSPPTPPASPLEGRPLWYRAAALLEPLRPWFVWTVRYRRVLQFLGVSTAIAPLMWRLLRFVWARRRARRGRLESLLERH